MALLTGTEGTPAIIGRDAAVDLVKAACLLIVVGLHAMMAGFTVDDRGLNITNSLAGHPIFAWATWGLQVMPLFFLLGGFSSLTQWRRMQAQGATSGDYIRQRVHRLGDPALLPIALVAVTLAIAVLAGASNDVLGQIGFRIGQPLWFLAVYIGCSGFIPLMARLHDRAPVLALLGLLGLAMLVDTALLVFENPAIGACNFLFVWLFVQQLGFWYADGWFLRRPRWLLFALFLGAFGTLLLLTTVVGYSTDMYENLNPPTICILVLGIGQLALFSWAHPWLERLARGALLSRAANAVNAHSMSIYLWHLPVVVIVGLTSIAIRLPVPEPLSRAWWETRPLFLLAIAVALTPVILLVSLYNRRRSKLEPVTATWPWMAALQVALAVAGVAVILLVGFTPAPAAALGLTLLFVAVRIRSFRKRGITLPHDTL